jgi:hypothetical protein
MSAPCLPQRSVATFTREQLAASSSNNWHAQDDNPDAATMRHWAPIEGIREALELMPVKW